MMLYLKNVVQEDMEDIISRKCVNYGVLDGKNVLITGATGMLAYYMTCVLMYLNEKKGYNITVYALVRNKSKAEKKFETFLLNEKFKLLVQDVSEPITIDGGLDYIVHAAGGASPYLIKNDPVGIINANIKGTEQVIRLALDKKVKNVLYTSTREIYGKVEGVEWINESDMGSVDPADSRSCYPESKRMAEQLFRAYHAMYGVPYTVVRIAHSYGPGMIINNDGRVMSDFMNDVVNDRDIVLKSTGEAIRSFCYINDAVTGMFMVLLNGADTEAYNISNENEPYMIRDIARMLIDVSGKNLKLEYVKNSDQSVYCNYKRVGLSTEKIRKMGWVPEVALKKGLNNTLTSM